MNNMYMYLEMEMVNGLQPEVPEWTKAEKMEMSYSQAELWSFGKRKKAKGN